MGEVMSNEALVPGIHLMKVKHDGGGRMGQFYMVRGWNDYPLLARPISLHDASRSTVSFLYRMAGEGTRLLANLRRGDVVSLEGPFGNGFPASASVPAMKGRTAIVGGGLGTAPMLLAAKQLPGAHVYLGFSSFPFREEAFSSAAGKLTIRVGGLIGSAVDPSAYDVILACGPTPMMKGLTDLVRQSGAACKLYVSIEKRMACGIGACYVCSTKVKDTNQKVCADGPVFDAEEVDWDALTKDEL